MIRVMKAVSLVALCTLIIAVPSVWANWVQDGAAICTTAINQWLPIIISDGAGGAIVTWYAGSSGGDDDVYAQRVNASGSVQWAANGVPLCTAMGDQDLPMITSDCAGGAIVTWEDFRGGHADIFAQRINALGVVQWTANGVALCTATLDQSGPTIVSDGVGGAIVTWMDLRSGYETLHIYAQKVNAAGAVQWTTNGVALCTATAYQQYPTIVSDGAGGAIVTWEDYRSGTNGDIYVQWVNASGAVQWMANGVALCVAAGDQRYPAITSDGAGGAIITWYDKRAGNNDIYAQRVSASGAVEWTTDGVPLCTAAGYQGAPTIVPDDAGGAIVTWGDGRNGDYDIYAQRLDASGAVQWRTDGVALCTATGDQYWPTIVPDGAGGAVVTWHDFRSGTSWDIYAQRVNASGSVQWTANGVALCTASGDQEFPTIASDDAGGATVTWMDYRSGTNFDIYAQRVDANGFAVLTAADAPAVPLHLNQNYPNPFNPTTTVTYSVPEKSNVILVIYDVSGKRIACLVDGQQEKGSHSVEWSGKDEKGSSVASGIYVYRLAAGGRTISKKMVVLR